MIAALLLETDASTIAAKFHNTLAAMIVQVAQAIGEPQVVLSGGCFQNRVLLNGAVTGLRKAGFTPFWPQKMPPNDGGIALGQMMAALRGMDDVSGSTGQINQQQR